MIIKENRLKSIIIENYETDFDHDRVHIVCDEAEVTTEWHSQNFAHCSRLYSWHALFIAFKIQFLPTYWKKNGMQDTEKLYSITKSHHFLKHSSQFSPKRDMKLRTQNIDSGWNCMSKDLQRFTFIAIFIMLRSFPVFSALLKFRCHYFLTVWHIDSQ